MKLALWPYSALAFAVFCVLCRVSGQDIFTNGLVAFYSFSGNTIDASGSGNNGAIIGYDWRFSADRFNTPNSLYFNQTSPPSISLDGAYMVAPRTASLDFNQDFTISLWMNIPTGVGDYYVHSLVSNGPDQPANGFTNGINLRLITDSSPGKDYLQFLGFGPWWTGSPDGDTHVSLDQLRNTWRQVAVVHAGTNINLFCNGALVTNATVTGMVSNSAEIWFGRHMCPGYPSTCAGSYPLIGGIDEIRLYDRAFTRKEMIQLYGYERSPLPNLAIAIKTIRLTLSLIPGTTNQLDYSTGLGVWAPYGPPFVATNSITFEDVDIFDTRQQFFRVRMLVP